VFEFSARPRFFSFFFSPTIDSLFEASSFSFSKATDCTSAALRGGREADSGIEEDREMIHNESRREDEIAN